MTPREVDQLTPDEYAAMWRLIDRVDREHKRAEREARRRSR